MKTNELKPCPFCGGEASYFISIHALCERAKKQLFTPKILHTIRFDCKTAYLNLSSCWYIVFVLI